MIKFDEYYNVSAEDVEYIQAANVEGVAFPYQLTVHTKSGQDLAINYKDSKDRDTVKAEIVRQVDCQKRHASEKVLSMLYDIKCAVELIDSRELRIWRQLRDLLGVRIEEEKR